MARGPRDTKTVRDIDVDAMIGSEKEPAYNDSRAVNA